MYKTYGLIAAPIILVSCSQSADPENESAPNAALATAGIAVPASFEFGDDSSEYTLDGECDDPRLTGPNVANELLIETTGKDATDCAAAVKEGTALLNALYAEPESDADIQWGIDAGDFNNDGECDDPRFAGANMTTPVLLVEDIGTDASDCRAAFAAGTISWKGAALSD